MHDYFITELPDKYYDKQRTIEAAEREIRKMVQKNPVMFTGKRWDKYREKQQEETEDERI